MGKLVRKNLIVDTDELNELTRRFGTSASALVRRLIQEELADLKFKDEMAAALDRLDADLAADFADHLDKLYGPTGDSERAAGAAS
jgi:hypothetical protein